MIINHEVWSVPIYLLLRMHYALLITKYSFFSIFWYSKDSCVNNLTLIKMKEEKRKRFYPINHHRMKKLFLWCSRYLKVYLSFSQLSALLRAEKTSAKQIMAVRGCRIEFDMARISQKARILLPIFIMNDWLGSRLVSIVANHIR